eukprot:CAMPEP_0206461584 /NCGR_PEP_ID=MMETSP0324_2-20121206/25459_1 /ASSEMBLY_ACC=CAM_ASM_000836 /TAXON_ID=2866 /ORGANISM="Crypthecodinium cohnii, Strain Seligo" /LENGTH=201 /DNA_ID=CAMNT_0053933555 /DNA_START=134 /DNA_END=739 /DNA_ORIENTATION=+
MAAPIRNPLKAALRKTVADRIKALDEAEILRQSEAVAERLQKNPWYEKSKAITLFLSMPTGELQTSKIVENAFKDGKRVFCPRVMGKGHMEMFEVFNAAEVPTLPLSKWKIPEPPTDRPMVDPPELDLMVVPAVALNLQRARCGHGAGFYDRYILRAQAGGRCKTVGIGLTPQLYDDIPEDEHDQRLDGVIFPDTEAFAAE